MLRKWGDHGYVSRTHHFFLAAHDPGDLTCRNYDYLGALMYVHRHGVLAALEGGAVHSAVVKVYGLYFHRHSPSPCKILTNRVVYLRQKVFL